MIAQALALVADPEVLARIGGPLGEAARAAQRDLAKLDATASRAKRAAWTAAARAPLPGGLRGIDASWIEHALGQVTHDRTERNPGPVAIAARRVIADAPETPTDVWLARWVCAALPAMPAIDPAIERPRSTSDVIRMAGPALRAWLEEVGADQLAFALGAKTAGAVSSRLALAAARIAQAPRVGELGERRAAIERARTAIDETALVRVGARSIAWQTNDLERVQIALRLPRALGLPDELDAFAGSVGPSWRALAAP